MHTHAERGHYQQDHGRSAVAFDLDPENESAQRSLANMSPRLKTTSFDRSAINSANQVVACNLLSVF